MTRDLDFALALADLADSISLPRFRARDLAVDTKSDLTPVTDADRAVERALRERLGAERPGEDVLGEEEGGGAAGGSVRWILDPVDGTKNFSRGIPIWGTLIALEREGEVVVGVASCPALGRRWWAERGAGAFADGSPIRVSRVARIEDAVVSFMGRRLVTVDPFVAFLQRAWHVAMFSDCWQHLLVAEGSVDAAIDRVVNPWDVAAVRVIVEEAGGRSTDFGGGRALDGGSLVSSNGLVHDDVLAALARP